MSDQPINNVNATSATGVSRRGLLSGVAVASAAAGLAVAARAAPAKPISFAATGKRPNILVIFGDDVGWMNLSCYGGDIMGVPTPNIDRLAAQGLRLTSFYAQPSCTAGRAAFLTGQIPIRTGLTTVGLTGSAVGLKPEDVTIAEILKTLGYATAQFGKNHLGDRDEHLPTAHGFDEFFGNLYHLNANEDLEDSDRPADPAFRKKYDPRGVISATAGGAIVDTGPLTSKRMEAFDDELVAKSIDFMNRKTKAGEPFFVWHNASRLHVFLHLKAASEGKSRAGNQDIYGDALAEHDGHVGQLMDRIDALGIADNTIVIYTTDNGAYQYMWPSGGTSPFRGDKGTTWEGGVRVPFIVRWPGAKAGRVSAEMVAMEDMLPTLATAAGAPDVVSQLLAGITIGSRTYKLHLDGYDQTALFTGASAKSARDTFFYYDETVLSAVRMGPYKVTFTQKTGDRWDSPPLNLGRPRITNLLMDPFERQDGDINRQLNEHKAWLLPPVLELVNQHLASFRAFPPRQTPLSANFGATIENAKLKLELMQAMK